eukprot:763874-Hanusia_phi.AAC.2
MSRLRRFSYSPPREDRSKSSSDRFSSSKSLSCDARQRDSSGPRVLPCLLIGVVVAGMVLPAPGQQRGGSNSPTSAFESSDS